MMAGFERSNGRYLRHPLSVLKDMGDRIQVRESPNRIVDKVWSNCGRGGFFLMRFSLIFGTVRRCLLEFIHDFISAI